MSYYPAQAKLAGHWCHIAQRWEQTSSHGCPVIGISECQVCGEKATESAWYAWQARHLFELANS